MVSMAWIAGTRAQAGLIFDSIDPNSNSGSYIDNNTSLGGYGPLAGSFSTGGQDLMLDDLKLRLLFIGDRIPTTVSVVLTDNISANTTPGATLLHIGDINAANYNQENATLDFSNISYQLAANHRYWIELSTPLHGPAWTLSFAPFGVGVTNEFIYSSAFGQSFANDRSGAAVFQMQVSATAGVPVPEPSSAVLAALGGVTVIATARRRRDPQGR